MIPRVLAISALLAAAMVAITLVSAAAAAPMQAGVNLAGLEFGSHYPGVLNADYVVPTLADLKLYKSHGIRLIRLPISWQRLQPNLFAQKPDTTLNAAYLLLIRRFVAEAGARGMHVIVDLHDYGGYGTHKLGDPTLPTAALASLWHTLATKLAGTPGLAGYDLMNEPNAMPNPAAWPQAAQAAADAIRGVDRTTTLFIEGDHWASADLWPHYNASLTINDPANHTVYEAHVYGDRDNTGSHFAWADEAAHGSTVTTIADRVAIFAGWCQAQHRTCMIGEVGVGSDNPAWNTQLANGLAAMKASGMIAFTYWAGGPWWGTYPMSLNPRPTGDAPQMDVVAGYAK